MMSTLPVYGQREDETARKRTSQPPSMCRIRNFCRQHFIPIAVPWLASGTTFLLFRKLRVFVNRLNSKIVCRPTFTPPQKLGLDLLTFNTQTDMVIHDHSIQRNMIIFIQVAMRSRRRILRNQRNFVSIINGRFSGSNCSSQKQSSFPRCSSVIVYGGAEFL